MQTTIWPKQPPPLTDAQRRAREEFMRLWHEELPRKYSVIERFNHGYPAALPVEQGWRTLEIGAGLGEHAQHERLDLQDYYFLEYRAEFCEEIAARFGNSKVVCGDIHERQPWPDGYFDRVVAVHVLEHLVNLPVALDEVGRLLKPDGFLDIVIPCEGAPVYTLARRISSQRMFERRFGMPFEPIIRNEHVSTYPEIEKELRDRFTTEQRTFFPLRLPLYQINLVVGMRLQKISR